MLSFKDSILTTFADLGLSDSILQVLPELGINTPSEIQEKAIPILLKREGDFIGLAQTGTGKTAAFGLPLLASIDINDRATQALVLAPTRELGQQIAEQLKAFAKYEKGLKVLPVYGGANIVPQINDLKRGVHVVIATPGRLLDLLKRKAVKLDQIKTFVLDEADEMLNMGFKEDIDSILSFASGEQVTWLFSATMSKDIRHIVKNFMTDPAEVSIDTLQVVNKNIAHQVARVKSSDKAEALKRFMDSEPNLRGIVFCRTKLDTQRLAEDLQRRGYAVDAIHGDLSQHQRDKVMGMFKDHRLEVLIATDVAARGIDVNDVTHVIHYAMPDDIEYYTHRSGRTARAGKKGVSISFANKGELKRIQFLERKLGISFEQVELPSVETVALTRMSAWATGMLTAEGIDKVKPDVKAKVHEVLADLSKEELVDILLAKEYSKFDFEGKSRDINDRSKGSDRGERGDREPRSRRRDDRGDRGDRRDRDRGDRGDRRRSDRDRPARSERSERPERAARPSRAREYDAERASDSNASSGDSDRFFINLGKKDGLGKGDLIEFLIEETKIKKSDIGNIQIEGSSAKFEVSKAQSKKVVPSFEGLVIEGRPIKVGRDGDGSDAPKRKARD